MKAYRLEVIVLDFEEYGDKDILAEFNNSDLVNKVRILQTKEMGDSWTDDNPINQKNCAKEDIDRFFQ